jgi:DNA-binding MarR family transcriptional regulator
MSARRRDSVLQSLERLRRLRPELNFMHVITFLYVCENEGLSVSELAQVCGTTRATASRNARGLAERGAPGSLAPWAGWLEARANPADAHGRQLFLTPAGRRLRDEIDALIAEARPIVDAA